MKLNEIEYDLTMVGQWLGKKFNKKGTYIDYGLVPSNTTY